MRPQSGVGGWTPTPMKLSVAIAKTAKASRTTNSTRTTARTLGRTSRNMMYASPSVRTRAASMYSSSRSASTAARTLRATIGASGIATATTMAGGELPSAASVTLAKMTTGSARNASRPRETTSSTTPRRYPQTSPTVVPAIVASSAAAGARNRISRPPSITRTNESRPSESVPNQCAADGGASACSGSVARGSFVASSGPKVAHSTQNPTIAMPATNVRERNSRRTCSWRAARTSSAGELAGVVAGDRAEVTGGPGGGRAERPPGRAIIRLPYSHPSAPGADEDVTRQGAPLSYPERHPCSRSRTTSAPARPRS